MRISRPAPPQSLIDLDELSAFEPSPDLEAWLHASFIDPDAPLFNPDHTHLQHARLGVLWTNHPNTRAGRRIVGQCELGKPQAMGAWARARAELQVRHWFGGIPDFVLTFDAHYAAECEDDAFCALVEHELYHAGQERDAFGAPKFRKAGGPALAIRGHDVEEFVGVVQRYGAAATGVQQLVDAAIKGPKIAPSRIAGACGTCLRAAA